MSNTNPRFVLLAGALTVFAIPLIVSASPSNGQAQASGSIDLPIKSMMTEYDFVDEPNPQLETYIDATGGVDLVNGSPQIELITSSYSGSTVTVSIVPPSGWTLESVTWDTGNGTFPIPDPGQTVTYSFNYVVAQASHTKSNGGVFKIKKPSS